MNATAQRALSQYTAINNETGVAAASPEELIVMLYDGAVRSIGLAKIAMDKGDHSTKGQFISKAIGIIDDGLKAALNVEAGGEIAASLSELYDYMTYKLMLSNIRNEPELLDEVSRLLVDLKSAWDALAKTERVAPVAVAAESAPAMQRAAASYGKV